MSVVGERGQLSLPRDRLADLPFSSHVTAPWQTQDDTVMAHHVKPWRSISPALVHPYMALI